MIALAEAQRRIAALPLPPARHESVALAAAVGRVVAVAPASDLDLPPFDRVTMDGFALRAADVVAGRRLRVVAAVAAGAERATPIGPGEAVRIMTGAPLPPGADAVVPIEEATVAGEIAAGGTVTFARGAQAGQNVHPRATDLRVGTQPIAVGTRVTAAMVPLLATLGCVTVAVERAVTVALIATGDELIEPSQRPRGAQIRESNRAGLAAQVASAGATVRALPIVRDDPVAILDALETALACDVVLMTGGSSAGDFDYTHEVLAAVGAQLHFDQVRIKPGKPVIVATRGDRVIFGLPGNPVSAFVTFELLVRPLLERRAGATAVWPRALSLPIATPLRAPAERDLLQVARLEDDGAGSWRAAPLHWSGSGDLVAMAGANALVHVAQARSLAAGERAPTFLLGDALAGVPRATEPQA